MSAGLLASFFEFLRILKGMKARIFREPEFR